MEPSSSPRLGRRPDDSQVVQEEKEAVVVDTASSPLHDYSKNALKGGGVVEATTATTTTATAAAINNITSPQVTLTSASAGILPTAATQKQLEDTKLRQMQALYAKQVFEEWNTMKDIDDDNDNDTPPNVSAAGSSSTENAPLLHGRSVSNGPSDANSGRRMTGLKLWNNVRKVVKTAESGGKKSSSASSEDKNRPSGDNMDNSSSKNNSTSDNNKINDNTISSSNIINSNSDSDGKKDREARLIQEDDEFKQYWESFTIPAPEISLADIELGEFNPPDVAQLESDFVTDASPLELQISRVPEHLVSLQKEIMSKKVWEERARTVAKVKDKEVDLVWREHLARQRVVKLEEEARKRLYDEKAKFQQYVVDKEDEMGSSFRKGRENIEEYVKNQNIQVKEQFGEVLVAQSSLGRKLEYRSKNIPTAVEVRVRFMRAVKSKLPKGAYVAMLSQFDSLGGRPLWWSKLGPYGIANMPEYPAVTAPVKHYGRYSDREIKFEDSVFALCPPTDALKPSYVFVLEIFQLRSRLNPYDNCVAWTALPMCNEHNGVIRGKIKLPLLRGSHSSVCASFKDMEGAISEDLNKWLCNIYIDVNHFPLSAITKIDGLKIEFDYLNKKLIMEDQDEELAEKLREKLVYTDGSDSNGGIIDEKERLLRGGSFRDLGFSTKEPSHLSSSGVSKQMSFNVKVKEVDKGLFHRNIARANSSAGWEDESDHPLLPNTNPAVSKLQHVGKFNSSRTFSRKEVDFVDSSDDEEKKKKLSGGKSSTFGRMLSNIGSLSFSGYAKISPRGGGDSSSSNNHVFGGGESKEYNNTNDNDDDYYRDDIERGTSNERVPLLQGGGGGHGQKDGSSSSSSSSPRALLSAEDRKLKYAEEFIERPNRALSMKMKSDRNLLLSRRDDDVDDDDDPSKSSHSADMKVKIKGIKHSKDSEHATEVLERGYDSGDEFFLDSEQKGKLVGIEAIDDEDSVRHVANMLEGKVVRRFESDGPRFDSEAILDPYSDNKTLKKIYEDAQVNGDTDDNINGGNLMNKEAISSSPTSLYSTKFPRLGALGKGSSILTSAASLSSKSPTGHDNQQQQAKNGKSNAPAGAPTPMEWKELKDERDIDMYTMALVSDPSQRKRLLPSAVSKVKLRFLYMEVFGDLARHLWGTMEFYITLFVFAAALWMRIYVHFLSEYLAIAATKTPIYGFNLGFIIISYKYMSTAVPFTTEVLAVAAGPCANIVVFSSLIGIGKLFQEVSGFMPDNLSKFIACYGVVTIFNPFLILLVDLMYNNFNCAKSFDACVNVADAACTCYETDAIKLWNRTLHDEGSGITGLVFTLVIYFATAVIGLFLLYFYLVNLHKNSRIIDIWRRINGEAEEFFIPDDFEVSMDELSSALTAAKSWRGLDGSTRSVQVLSNPNFKVNEPIGVFSSLVCMKHYAIYEIASDQKKWSLHRHFMLLSNGSLVEIFQQYRSDSGGGQSLLAEALDEFIRMESQLMTNKHSKGFGGGAASKTATATAIGEGDKKNMLNGAVVGGGEQFLKAQLNKSSYNVFAGLENA